MRQKYLNGTVARIWYPLNVLGLLSIWCEDRGRDFLLFLIIVDMAHTDSEKHINSTRKLPRNLLHEMVLGGWAEILIIRNTD